MNRKHQNENKNQMQKKIIINYTCNERDDSNNEQQQMQIQI